MAVFVALLLLVGVAVAGFAIRQWLSGRLSPVKDHSKKHEELNDDVVEIVVQKSTHERRLKLALPDFSSIPIRSPVGPMKSSIRSALKELRSRQMVQSLCSKFEAHMKVSGDTEESTKGATTMSTTETVRVVQPSRARRRDARDATVTPVLLAREQTKETEITAKARSNNLNKFLQSFASNLDNTISAERRVITTSGAISSERCIVMSTDAEDDADQPLLAQAEEIELLNEALADNIEAVVFELDLQTLRLEAEYSNQCNSPLTADNEVEDAELVGATDCEPVVDESLDEPDEGNNNHNNLSFKLTKAFTITDWRISDVSKLSDCNPESCSAPAVKALDLFKQQVPSNRRARLNFNL